VSGRLSTGGLVQQVRWARDEGVARVLEEKDLRLGRVGEAVARTRWRRRHAVDAQTSLPVWVLGLQRSGTNMVMRTFSRMAEVDVCNEDDRRGFNRYRLRSDARLRRVVALSPFEAVVAKPLCDSHRAVELLERVHAGRPGRAVWVYRGVDGRVRSAQARFGDHARVALADVAAGRGAPWQGQGLPAATLDVLRAQPWDAVSVEEAQAWLWWARNSLVFDLGLDRRNDVLVVDYDRLVEDPNRELARMVGFLGLSWRPELASHVEARRPSGLRLESIDGEVRQRCDELTERLRARAAT